MPSGSSSIGTLKSPSAEAEVEAVAAVAAPPLASSSPASAIARGGGGDAAPPPPSEAPFSTGGGGPFSMAEAVVGGGEATLNLEPGLEEPPDAVSIAVLL